MDIQDILQKSGGLASIARELGLSESQAASGASALLPAILGGVQKPAGAQLQGGGLDALGGLLGRLGGGGMMDEVLANRPTNVSAGNEILGALLGGKEQSRAVASQAAGVSGIDPALLKKMLPMLAMVLGGYMAKQGGGAGGLGGLLGGLLGGGGRSAGGGLGDLLGKLTR